MWTFSQSEGTITNAAGQIVGTGYAGNGDGLNNPAMQDQHGIGPLPQGKYTIGPLQAQHGALGTNVAPLEPHPDNEMYGRSGFFIHGRKSLLDMDASEGCIVLDHDPRMRVMEDPDKELQVVA